MTMFRKKNKNSFRELEMTLRECDFISDVNSDGSISDTYIDHDKIQECKIKLSIQIREFRKFFEISDTTSDIMFSYLEDLYFILDKLNQKHSIQD